MALSESRITELYNKWKRAPNTGWRDFARAIEAEVRKQDEALIRQMLEALETCNDGDGYNGPYQYYETVPVEEAVAAARARLGSKP